MSKVIVWLKVLLGLGEEVVKDLREPKVDHPIVHEVYEVLSGLVHIGLVSHPAAEAVLVQVEDNVLKVSK